MSEYVVSDTYSYLLQPDTILPTQYFAGLRRKGEHEPERRLAIAILEDAVECFQKHVRARDRKARQLFEEAEEWIRDEDRKWPFSFENICELLHINAAYLRRGLLSWKESELGRPAMANVRAFEPALHDRPFEDEPLCSVGGR